MHTRANSQNSEQKVTIANAHFFEVYESSQRSHYTPDFMLHFRMGSY